jgi:hypothetical protein
MKKIIVLLVIIAACTAPASAQQSLLPAVDKSPLDVCYYPVNYPVLKIRDKATEPLAARVIYSRPKANGRTVFGDLVKYGEVWRLGANEATEIEFYKPVTIGDKKVPKGRYSLYAIPRENSWTFVLNKETDTWGAFKYDESKDILRTDAPVQKSAEPVEAMAMTFEKGENNIINLVVAWENVKVALPVNIQ